MSNPTKKNNDGKPESKNGSVSLRDDLWRIIDPFMGDAMAELFADLAEQKKTKLDSFCQELANSGWDPGLARESYGHILECGLRGKNLQLAAVAAELAFDQNPTTLRGLFYRIVSAGRLPSTDAKHYNRTGRIMTRLPAVLNLAAAGAIELGEAADIASNIAGGFGLASDEIGRVADVLAQAAASSNTSILELGEAFAKAAPAAKAAGQTIEEASAAIGILGDSGVKSSVAGTDLQNILIVMAKKAEIASVKTTDTAGNVRDMLDVMKELGGATSGLSEAERLSFFIDVFGKRSAKSAIILSSANKRIDEMREKMANAEGRAKSMAATMEGGIGGSLRKVRSAVEGVAISIGESLAPTFKSIAAWVAKAAAKIKTFIEENKGVTRGRRSRMHCWSHYRS